MTLASTIIDAAIATSLANDAGRTDLAGDQSGELLPLLNRLVRKVYALAGIPRRAGGWQTAPYFTTTGTVTIGTPNTTLVALPATPESVYLVSVINNVSRVVNIVPRHDVQKGVADFPPAIILQNQQVASAARTGDPSAGAILTVEYAYLPPLMTAVTNTIGAKTAAGTDTAWPDEVGDQYLIDSLARYLAVKDGTRDESELASLTASLQEHAGLLASVIGVDSAMLMQATDA